MRSTLAQLRNAVNAAASGNGILGVSYAPTAAGLPSNTLALTGDGTGKAVTISNVAAGKNDTDAVNYAQVKNNVGYDTDASGARTGTITLGGQNSPAIRMANLADGVLASDAATVGQVKQAKAEANAYTDSQVGACATTPIRPSTTSADRSATRGGRPGAVSPRPWL